MVVEYSECVAEVLEAEAWVLFRCEPVQVCEFEASGECVDVNEVAWLGAAEQRQELVAGEIFDSQESTLCGGHRRKGTAGDPDIYGHLVISVVDVETHEVGVGPLSDGAQAITQERVAGGLREYADIDGIGGEEIQVGGRTIDDAVHDERSAACQSHCACLG